MYEFYDERLDWRGVPHRFQHPVRLDGADGREELLRHLLVESDGVSKTGSPLDDFEQLLHLCAHLCPLEHPHRLVDASGHHRHLCRRLWTRAPLPLEFEWVYIVYTLGAVVLLFFMSTFFSRRKIDQIPLQEVLQTYRE